jgi:hypothetical protein
MAASGLPCARKQVYTEFDMGRTVPTGTPEDDRARIVERPDGYYWQSEDRKREYGPFPNLVEAVADMQAADDDSSYEPGETLEEAEDEIGISRWIDPETGQPAEDSIPRTEDH